MKTLSKSLTSRFFVTSDGYAQMVARWSQLVNDPDQKVHLTASHHLLYLTLRGKDVSKSFPPITNAVKLEGGENPNRGYLDAFYGLSRWDYRTRTYFENGDVFAIFDGLLEADVHSKILALRVKDNTEYVVQEEVLA